MVYLGSKAVEAGVNASYQKGPHTHYYVKHLLQISVGTHLWRSFMDHEVRVRLTVAATPAVRARSAPLSRY